MSVVSVSAPAPARRELDSAQHWASRGNCVSRDPDDFFVVGADQNKVKSVCRGCPVLAECLADALDHRIEFGVWGGMTERERRKLLRDRPGVTNWLPILREALDRSDNLDPVALA